MYVCKSLYSFKVFIQSYMMYLLVNEMICQNCSCHFQEETEIREVERLFQGHREGGDPNPPTLSSVPFYHP